MTKRRPTPDGLDTEHSDAEIISVLPWAFRYTLGRSTYAVHDVAPLLERLAPKLHVSEAAQYVKEIDAAAYLGMRMDEEAWLRARAALVRRIGQDPRPDMAGPRPQPL